MRLNGPPDLRNPFERSNQLGAGEGSLGEVVSAAQSAVEQVKGGSGDAGRAAAALRQLGSTIATELKATRDELQRVRSESERQMALLRSQIKNNRG